MKTCPTCGNTCDDQCIFCASCGYKFEGDGNSANAVNSTEYPNDEGTKDSQQSYQGQPQPNSQQSYQGQSQQNSQQSYQGQPQPNSQQSYQGQPQQSSQQSYQGQPQPNSQQSYQGQPQQSSQQPYQGQPQPNSQQSYQGQPQPNSQQSYCPSEKPRNNPLAIASLVLGILGAVFACCYGGGIIPAILAIIFGVISRNDINRPGNNEGGMGMSKAGLILGIISVVLAIITLIFIAVCGISALSLTNELSNGGNFTTKFNT